MFWSMAPLVLACIVLAGLAACARFSPAVHGRARSPIRRRDGAEGRRRDARVPDPVAQAARWLAGQLRLPRRVEGARTDPGTGQKVRAKVSTVGYIAPSGMYVSLIQSNADQEKLVRFIDTDMYPREPRTSTA